MPKSVRASWFQFDRKVDLSLIANVAILKSAHKMIQVVQVIQVRIHIVILIWRALEDKAENVTISTWSCRTMCVHYDA